MSRTCWWIDRQWARSDDTVQDHCTCAEESPDFNVKLPTFMDFSPTELPTTGIMTTSSETPSGDTTSPTPTNATSLIAEATSAGWPLRTVSTVTQHAQEAAENSASTLKGATPHSQLTSKSLSTLSSATTVDRNTTFVFLRTTKPSVSTDSEGFTSPQLHKDPSYSPGTESTVRTTTEDLLEVTDTGFNLNNVNQTKHFVEEGKENESKHGSGNTLTGDFAVGSTKRIPLNKKSHIATHHGYTNPSSTTNILHTNTIATSYPPNTLQSVTNTDSSNLITNDAVTTKIPQRINHVSMVTKSYSNVNSRISSTTVKSRRRTSGRITPLSSSVLYSSVSSWSVSSGGIHVSSRSTSVPHHPSSESPGLNASHGGGRDSRLMLVATTSSGAACILLLLFTLLIFLICRSRGKKRSSRDIDVIPVTNEEGGSLQGTPTPGVLKRQRAGPEGNNNPTLTESQDNGIDGSANSSSSNSAAATNTIVTLTDTTLQGDPV